MKFTMQALPSALEINGANEEDVPRISHLVSHTLSFIYNPGYLTKAAGLIDVRPTGFIVGTALFFGNACLSVCDTVFEISGPGSTMTLPGSAMKIHRSMRFKSAEHVHLSAER